MALEITVRPRPRKIDDLTLRIAGTAISGWTSIRVTRGIERMPSSFEISLTERDSSGLETSVNDGDPCEVLLGGDKVITGYVDGVSISIDATQHSLTVTGRSKAADFVDCSAEYGENAFRNMTPLSIMQALAEPYGITVAATGDPGKVLPYLPFALTDTPFAIAERICRYAGLLFYDRPDGSIVLTGAGTKKAASGFQEGQNIQSARAMFRMDQRFSEYRAFICATDIFKEISADGNLIAIERDPNVKRPRKKYLIAESGDSSFDIARKRAKWQCARNAGRGRSVVVTADSWRDKDDKLWEPNTLVPLSAPALKLRSAELLIVEVSYRRDDRGTTAELTLMPREAFLPEPILLFPQPTLIKRKAN